jgi:malonyl-CoA decarboxylase
MMPNDFFSDLLSTISGRGRTLLGRASSQQRLTADDVVALCDALLSSRGEASGTAVARDVLDAYAQLDADGRGEVFAALAHRFGPDDDRLRKAAQRWESDPTDATATDLHFASEPRRQELFRRLNRAPGATRELVAMRADLLECLAERPALKVVDRDMVHLLASWFNRGFLVLRRIDWSTPAIILEKVIRYEAVHEIRGWADLRRRIDPADRRCYAFFHPALNDEPLIFVEVALTESIPQAIAPLLAEERVPTTAERARTAVFYSISNCQKGLAGITFGNFLIKQVVEELRREMPKLDTFVTLSPVPGFLSWLKSDDAPLADADRARIAGIDATADVAALDELRPTIEPLAAHYFLKAKNGRGQPIDPVARFHLGNGARLERIDWLGDVSAKGLQESAGLMVNYLYRLEDIEKNHEAFVNQGVVAASTAVRKMSKPEGRRMLDLRLS